MIITLDGPCGSGKSTLAQLLAQKLGFFYINSGYLYRSLAYILVTEFGYTQEQLHNPNLDDIALILDQNNFNYIYEDGIAQVFFKGTEITQYLKNSSVSHDASIVSAHAGVRRIVVPLQQYFGAVHNLVTDGRDGGTEIYPQAQFKFYVTAAPDIRAQRLQADLEKNGVTISFEQALEMTQSRDERDMKRSVSPLKKADDAVEIDTSHQSIHQTLDVLLLIIQA
ncbi:(d)CMP kinase [Candidatus Babeliales bacterium]|nr:(d)CMP kinase [Candidatus Babeliales bacterium]MBP9843724.1 (d)CMP kinase [Candidatus Babeliales bacterium]